ncbi:MAG: hypothetical protein JWQ27_397 [Ferruginibacter sp.]|nr:hypothetical protein [Ferruginibacter sp.]
MNVKILFAEAMAALLLVFGFRYSEGLATETVSARNDFSYQQRRIIACSPDWRSMDTDSLGQTMTVLPGWGTYRWSINTTSDSARLYFNQGINMYYAFHIIEAMASFKKAAQFDDNNPMIYWAQALAYGPNINDMGYAAVPDALAVTAKSVALLAKASAKEKLLIKAMHRRYSADSTISRAVLNKAYAEAMKQAYGAYPQDADISTLFADALLVQHPWDYWQHNGKAQPWTGEILEVLEKTLALHPQHPGANHYYIHAVEASPDPGRGLRAADRLGGMMPSVSHMVHMPSHIYIRTGNYQKGIGVNEMAEAGFEKYTTLYPGVQDGMFLYKLHNIHMRAACALLLADPVYALKAATDCQAVIDTSFLSFPQPLGNIAQYLYMTPTLAHVRFKQWDQLLALPAMSDVHALARGLEVWAKGMAFANKGNIPEAKMMLASLKNIARHADLQVANPPFNKGIDQVTIALDILEGTIASKDKQPADAIRFFEKAVKDEDALIYNEPRDWLLPARHFLAEELINQHAYSRAEKILKEDLLINPNNAVAIEELKAVKVSRKDANGKVKMKK